LRLVFTIHGLRRSHGQQSIAFICTECWQKCAT
jgi:hypothetical protein